MATTSIPISFSVYMNGGDLTPWVTAVEVTQPRRCLYRQWSVTLAGWSAVEDGATWDIYASHDSTNPRAECLVRSGIVPPDSQPESRFGAEQMPSVVVNGYDRVWLTQRRAPRDTIILAPDSDSSSVERAISEYGGPIGGYRVWSGMRTMHLAVKALGRAAGVNVRCLVPNYPLQALVVPPTSSYWDAMLSLLDPTAAEVWYRRTGNELVIVDPLSPRYGLGRRMTISGSIITDASAVPVRRRRVRRVIFRVPPC